MANSTDNDLGFTYQKYFLAYFLICYFKTEYKFWYESKQNDKNGDFIIGDMFFESKTGVTVDNEPLNFSSSMPQQMKKAISQSVGVTQTEKIIVTNREVQPLYEDMIDFSNIFKKSYIYEGKKISTDIFSSMKLFSIPVKNANNPDELISEMHRKLYNVAYENMSFLDMNKNRFNNFLAIFEKAVNSRFRSHENMMIDFRVLTWFSLQNQGYIDQITQENLIDKREEIDKLITISMFDDFSDIDEDVVAFITEYNNRKEKSWQKIVRLEGGNDA